MFGSLLNGEGHAILPPPPHLPLFTPNCRIYGFNRWRWKLAFISLLSLFHPSIRLTSLRHPTNPSAPSRSFIFGPLAMIVLNAYSVLYSRVRASDFEKVLNFFVKVKLKIFGVNCRDLWCKNKRNYYLEKKV